MPPCSAVGNVNVHEQSVHTVCMILFPCVSLLQHYRIVGVIETSPTRRVIARLLQGIREQYLIEPTHLISGEARKWKICVMIH